MTDSEAGAGVSGAVSCGGNSARGGGGTLSTMCAALTCRLVVQGAGLRVGNCKITLLGTCTWLSGYTLPSSVTKYTCCHLVLPHFAFKNSVE